MEYHCAVCGQIHDDLPDIGADKPDNWWGVPEIERTTRIKLTRDFCVIDGDQFFIRGVIEIPVSDFPENFGFGAWVSQSRDSFQTYMENFDTDQIGPFFGWLCTRIDYYSESTTALKTRARFRGRGMRPTIELAPSDHQLAIDQRDGIMLSKAWEIVHHYMRPKRPATDSSNEN